MLRCLLSGQLMLHYHTIGIFFLVIEKKITLSKSSGSLKQTNNEISGKCEKDNTLDFTVNWNLLNLFLDASPLCASLNWKYFLTVTLFAFPFCKTVITLWSFPLNVKYFPSLSFLSVSWSKANAAAVPINIPRCSSHKSASHRPDVRCVVNSASVITEQ